MITFIEILEGPDEGTRFKVEEGSTIGRTKADVLIKDVKVSSTHAKIEKDERGRLTLFDLDSSNGIHINGRRVKKVALLQGVTFEVGNTKFKVVCMAEAAPSNFSLPLTWREILKQHLSEVSTRSVSERVDLQSFSPAIKLVFTQGIQADEEIILGFGPRSAGSKSLDIELLEEGTPKEAFTLHPRPGGVEIKSSSPTQVRLNNMPIVSEILKDGDVISVDSTLIKVSYL